MLERTREISFFHRCQLSVAAIALLTSLPAQAIEFELGGTAIKFDNLVTVGGIMRMQERDSSLIAKSNLAPGICVARTNAELDPDKGDNTFSGTTCTTSQLAENERYVAARGSYAINGDNGNLNFDRYDLVHATAKLTSDLSVDLYGFNIFVRGLFLHDAIYSELEESHPDTTLQASSSDYPRAGKDINGGQIGLLDYFVSRNFELADRAMTVKLGNQVINWGESGFLLANSINFINPPNQALLRIPGFDIKELLQPVGMLAVNMELFPSINMEAFYQYEWTPVEVDPVGSFFSVSDTLGTGGRYAMLSFGKAPEDPENLYQARDNDNDPLQTLGSRAGRTIYRDTAEEKRREPDDGGQYGVSIKAFLEGFNNGTEIGFYFANYHSRIPSVSFISAQNGCVPDDTGTPLTNLLAVVAACGLTPRPDSPGDFDAATEPLPVDTARLVVEYPEDVRLFGASFNTTLGDFAWSGEYAFRPNLPVQIHTVDLTLAAVGPAFPNQDFNIGASVLPGERSATAEFVSVYRNVRHRSDGGYGYGPNEYIQGYERLKVGQLGTTFLKTIGGDNFLDATQIVVLLEMGLTHVLDFPELDELQFQGADVDTHISNGADGTAGISPRDLPAENRNPDDGDPCAGTTQPGGGAPVIALTPEDVNPRCLRQNPTANNPSGFGDRVSYGYRAITLTKYDSALFGANLEFLAGFFHDVSGVSPGLGQNFVEGRKQILAGIRWDYLSRITGELRYTWFTGGGHRDTLRDRDNLLLFLGYQF
jgi:hypothetical protein